MYLFTAPSKSNVFPTPCIGASCVCREKKVIVTLGESQSLVAGTSQLQLNLNALTERDVPSDLVQSADPDILDVPAIVSLLEG